MPAGRLLWYLVDGLPCGLVERYAHALPVLAGALAAGRVSRMEPVWPNCQTPPSLLTIFSGTPPRAHGLTGFDMPLLDGGDPLRTTPGFAWRPPPGTAMLWDRCAAAGQAVRLSHLPFVDEARLGPALRGYVHGFGEKLVETAVLPAGAGPAGAGWAPVAPGALARHVAIDRVAHVAVLGSARTRTVRDGAAAPDGATVDGFALSRPYRAGLLGPRVRGGGDGAAEALLCDSVAVVAERFFADFAAFVQAADEGLVVGYQPAYDVLFHELLGVLDPAVSYATPRARGVVEPLVLAALRGLDAQLAWLRRAARPGDRVVVSSDHGMQAVEHEVFVNVLLARDGLACTGPDGAVDPYRSAAFYHPAENGVLCLNRAAQARTGRGAAELLARLQGLFADATGEALAVERCAPAHDGGAFDAAHYLVPPRGTLLRARMAGGARGPTNKTADHCAASDDDRLCGVVVDLSAPERALAPRARYAAHELVDLVLA